MKTAVIVCATLIIIYDIAKIKLPFPIYAMIAVFPYKSLIAENCDWLDTCLEILLLAGCILCIWKSETGQECGGKAEKFLIPAETVCFIFILIAVTVIYAIYTNNPLFLLQTTDFRFYAGSCLLIIYMYHEVWNWKRVADLCHIFIINGWILQLAGCWKYFTGQVTRLCAFLNSNMFACLLAISIWCAAFIIQTGKQRKQSVFTAAYLITIITNAITIYLNRSTAVLLMLFVMAASAVIGMFKILDRRKACFIFLCGMIMISVFSMWVTIKGDALNVSFINKLMMRKGYYDTTRFYIWSDAWRQFKEHWLIGVGADNFRDTLTSYHYATHNDWLSYMVNYGSIGLGAFLFLCIHIYKNIFSVWDMDLFILLFALVSGVFVYMLSHNLTGNIIFWVIVEFVYCIVRIEGEEQRNGQRQT